MCSGICACHTGDYSASKFWQGLNLLGLKKFKCLSIVEIEFWEKMIGTGNTVMIHCEWVEQKCYVIVVKYLGQSHGPQYTKYKLLSYWRT